MTNLLIEKLAADLRSARVATRLCDPATGRDCRDAIDRWNNASPCALDTPMGVREHLRQGVAIIGRVATAIEQARGAAE